MKITLPQHLTEAQPQQVSAEDAELFIGFGQESEQKAIELEDLVLRLETTPEDLEISKEMYRILHTVKGTSACIGVDGLAKFAHKFEDYIVPFREGVVTPNSVHTSILLKATEQLKNALADLKQGRIPVVNENFWSSQLEVVNEKTTQEQVAKPQAPSPAEATVVPPAATSSKSRKVSVEIGVMDELLARSGNLTIIKDLLLQDLEALAFRYPDENLLKRSMVYMANMGKENDSIQSHIENLTKTEISSALRVMQRAVRDLSVQLGKKVKFEMLGTSIKIDYDLCQVLSDSLVHIARNAIDHGIEMPDERLRLGKSPEAKITVTISEVSEETVIEIADDGCGINAEKIKKKCLDKNLISPQKLATMSHEAVLALIFESGFSTTEKITEVSGRGVGLDMVMKSITAVRGRVQVASTLSVGTQFTITIPAKKATNILSVFVAGRNEQKLAIPREQVVEIKSMDQLKGQNRLMFHDDGVYVQYKGKYLELMGTASYVNEKNPSLMNPQSMIVFLEDQDIAGAIWVDDIYSIDKVIVKDFNSEIPSGTNFEKAALSGRFGLLLFLDLAISTKLLLLTKAA